jgi:regulator of sirC expression with transglutaminase-like and TPR domain
MDHMSQFAIPTSWDALTALRDEDIPLFWAALLVARDEYPDLDVSAYEARCDALERELRAGLPDEAEPQEQIAAINRFLFEEKGFAGNQQDYYDPRNSYLNDVLDRRLGIPLSLGLIQLELARRLGVPLEGVSFPGHFLVRLPVDGGLLVLDPYHRGRSVDADELRERAKPHLGGVELDDSDLLRLLAPASHRGILMRMLRNLKALYAEQEAWDKSLRCADRLVSLDPDVPEEIRDRGLLYLKLEHGRAAGVDLARYLELKPGADDAEAVRAALVEAHTRQQPLH